jgi:hypothetical protein
MGENVIKLPKKAQKFPFPFILDLLDRLQPRTRSMFGAHSVYVGEKLMLIVRNRESHPEANGVWVSTSKKHHAELRQLFPRLHSIEILAEGKGETDWQMLHIDDDDFETRVTEICELILLRDERIGKIPGKKRK